MISNITSKYQTNYKSLTKAAPSFAGDKDILIIDDKPGRLLNNKADVERILGEKRSEYTIHTVLGGKEGLEKAKQCKPFLTVTAYNMPQYEKPYGAELMLALKEFSKNIVVLTSCWWKCGKQSKKAGVKKCEEELGVTKYVYGMDFPLFHCVLRAIINGREIPKYPFQEIDEKLNGTFRWV